MIVAKANRMLGFLKRNCAGIVGSTVLLRLYCSLVRSHFCFFFKCLHGLVDFTREFSFSFSFLKGNTRRASSGLHLKLNACRTSSFRDFYFNRITLMWNSLPKNIKDSDTISSFKSKLKSFHFTRLLNAFDGDNFRSFKLICPKCRRANTSSVCTC